MRLEEIQAMISGWSERLSNSPDDLEAALETVREANGLQEHLDGLSDCEKEEVTRQIQAHMEKHSMAHAVIPAL
jgi:hypothetical protein